MVRLGLNKISKVMPLVYVIAIAALILFIPIAVRYKFYENSLIGVQAYYHIRAAEEYGATKTDRMSFEEKPFYRTPYHILLSKTNSELGSIAFPFLFGILSLLLFFLILIHFEIFGERLFYIMLLFVLSPIFTYLFVASTPHSLSMFLILLGCCLFIQRNKIMAYLSLIPFSIASFNIFNSVLIIVLAFSYTLIKKGKRAQFVVITVLLLLINIYFKNPFMTNYEIVGANWLELLFSEFGATAGLSIFQAILFFIGLFSIGKSKLKYFYALFIFFISAFVINPQSIFYTTPLFSFFAGEGFLKIIKSRWKSALIKDLMLTILISGILFSEVSYLKVISTSPPENEEIESLIWLKENTAKNTTVFSHYSNSYLIQTIGKRRTLLDPLSRQFDELANDSNTLFYSRNLARIEKILNRYNISYLWLNKRMKENIWKEEEEGLLFVLENSNKFKKVYENSQVEIWRYE